MIRVDSQDEKYSLYTRASNPEFVVMSAPNIDVDVNVVLEGDDQCTKSIDSEVQSEKPHMNDEVGLKRKRKEDPLPCDYLRKVAPAKDADGNRIDREEWIEKREKAAQSDEFLELEYEVGTQKFEEAKKQIEEGMKSGTFVKLTRQFEQMER